MKCKVCDVRDYETAKACVEAGADFVGIHGIWEIKRKRAVALKEIAERLPAEYEGVGVVLVTLATLPEKVLEMVRELRPGYIQLHSSEWTGGEVWRLKDLLATEGCTDVQVIAVGKVPAEVETIVTLLEAADMVLLDRTHYEKGEDASRVEPSDYEEPVAWARSQEKPCLIAGGLTPENVRRYVAALRPWGVDVQTGVELGSAAGEKDMGKVRAFIREARR